MRQIVDRIQAAESYSADYGKPPRIQEPMSMSNKELLRWYMAMNKFARKRCEGRIIELQKLIREENK